jgi:hypothetical protein
MKNFLIVPSLRYFKILLFYSLFYELLSVIYICDNIFCLLKGLIYYKFLCLQKLITIIKNILHTTTRPHFFALDLLLILLLYYSYILNFK